MTKEELEKEAKVFATYYESLFPDEFETFYKAFLKVAEPREEHISELEKENGNLKAELTEAKEIIRALLKHTYGQNLNTQNDFDLYLGRIKDAEQFLKDSEVDE